MALKIGVTLALDREKEFSNGMKKAQESAKLFDNSLKDLSTQYEENANSLEALSKKQELLKQKQEAGARNAIIAFFSRVCLNTDTREAIRRRCMT